MIKAILEDSFEKLVEQSRTQAKKTAKTAVDQIKQTFSPSKMWEQILGVSPSTSESGNVTSEVEEERSDGKTSEVKKTGNHTPLNLEKLGKKYQEKEKQKTENLRQKLFQLVKRGEEEVLQQKKQEEQEKEQKEVYEVEEKKKKLAEKQKQEQMDDIPKGKIRRSIFSPKKVAQRQNAEVKPATGKH